MPHFSRSFVFRQDGHELSPSSGFAIIAHFSKLANPFSGILQKDDLMPQLCQSVCEGCRRISLPSRKISVVNPLCMTKRLPVSREAFLIAGALRYSLHPAAEALECRNAA